MNPIDEDLQQQINQLVDTYRDRCLWFLRADYYPTDLQEVLRTLDYIRRYGDREAFRKAGGIISMALTGFQQTVCRLIAANRLEQGEAYVAGGVALNLLADGRRISRDIDLFHDTLEALDATWQADRKLLQSRGYEVRSIHERPGYVEAVVGKGQADSGGAVVLAGPDEQGVPSKPYRLRIGVRLGKSG